MKIYKYSVKFEVLTVGAFYVLPYCNLVGDTDVSEEAVHFILGYMKM
jgi:hypothetical protein